MSTAHDLVQQTVVDRLLDSLDSLDRLVRRHRSLTHHSGEKTGSHCALHVELIADEVAQDLAMARGAWHRQPRNGEGP